MENQTYADIQSKKERKPVEIYTVDENLHGEKSILANALRNSKLNTV